jgi:hypothetical protein
MGEKIFMIEPIGASLLPAESAARRAYDARPSHEHDQVLMLGRFVLITIWVVQIAWPCGRIASALDRRAAPRRS